jgi:hypothetical protein
MVVLPQVLHMRFIEMQGLAGDGYFEWKSNKGTSEHISGPDRKRALLYSNPAQF